MVHLCIKFAYKICSQLQGGWTALMWGCYKGRTEVVRILLEAGANPNVKGEVSLNYGSL